MMKKAMNMVKAAGRVVKHMHNGILEKRMYLWRFEHGYE